MHVWTTYKTWILLGILIIFHVVGLFGITGTDRDYFLSLSPMNLVLSVVCVFLALQRRSYQLYIDFTLVFVVGLTVEWIGVHTGLLFGNYQYGANLGWKIAEVPLIIGANWVMLSLASTAIVTRLKVPAVVKAICSAGLMTGLDVLIEPVAVKSDYWSWHNGFIPIYNYVCWFVISFFVHWWLFYRKSSEQNRVSVGLFICLTVFFGILNFVS